VRALQSVFRMPIRSFSPSGSFRDAAERLSDVLAGGFDGVLLTAFDGRAGSIGELTALCQHLHALGLCVLLDIACLYNGIGSPSPVIEAAVKQGLADGFLMTGEEWCRQDVRDTVTAMQKANASLWFGLWDTPPTEGARPDGVARRGFSPYALLHAADADAAWTAATETVGRGRGPLLTDAVRFADEAVALCERDDAALVLSWLLPGVPFLADAWKPSARVGRPTDAERYAARRHGELLSRLQALHKTYPSLALSQGVLRATCEDGTLTFSRRVSDGTLYVVCRLCEGEGTVNERCFQSTPPCLTSGLYRKEGRLYLTDYGYAVCFVKKAEKPPRAVAADAESDRMETQNENDIANNTFQNDGVLKENNEEIDTDG